MREITPARKRALLHDFKTCQTKRPAPIVFRLERTWSSAATPLPIVCPTNSAVPPDRRDIFVNDRESAIAQHAAYLIQDEPRILCVMENITEQYSVEALIPDRKVAAIIGEVINPSSGAVSNVQTDYGCAEHALQVMCDETIAAADVEYGGSRRKHTGDFERHVICSTDFAAASHAVEATFDCCGQARHRWR
jgi:hypothetical protein